MAEKKVIIIDDDTRNIFALKATLIAKNYECQSFYDAKEALNALEKTDCDIILIDMMMPEMDGYEAIPMIRQIKGKEHIPIIAVTAQAMMGDKEKCIAAGADDYISKPIDVDKLLLILKERIN
ncbi:MAG TPA: response regulator [Bacteroidia bacterium]|jgi:CheY-like chemotaxis protein|nr:response regulator [Bacteroidia bacterium]